MARDPHVLHLARTRLGYAAYAIGRHDEAAGALERTRAEWAGVLRQDAGHRPTLAAMAEVESDPELLLDYKRTLAELSEGAERCALRRELGDLYRDAFRDPDSALAAYREALLIQPSSQRLLHR